MANRLHTTAASLWNDEKEKVREKMAVLLNADPDEIALLHNTTEGMNLIASSMQLKKGDLYPSFLVVDLQYERRFLLNTQTVYIP